MLYLLNAQFHTFMLWRRPTPPPDSFEQEIIKTITDGRQAPLNRLMVRLYNDPNLRNGLDRIRRTRNATKEAANGALNQAFVEFINTVREGRYTPGNWRGFVLVIAERRLKDNIHKVVNRQTREPLVDDFTPLDRGVMPLDDAGDTAALLQHMMHNAGLNENQRYVLPLKSEGFSYEEISVMLTKEGVTRSVINLRKDYSSGQFLLQQWLVEQRLRGEGALRFCHLYCKPLVEGRADGLGITKLLKKHPDLTFGDGQRPTEETMNQQHKTCIGCLAKQCRNSF